MRWLYYSIWLSIAISFMCIYSVANAQTATTGNVLNNSTFGTGNSTTTTGWSTDGDHGIHTHGAWNGFPYQTGMDDSGGVLAFEGHEEDNVYQDVDVVGDGHLTQSQMNQGFTSTMGADVWFWNSLENTLTLKQTITGADGSVSTQVREINDHDPNRSMNGGTFTNYTNEYIQGSNTQTDITIRAELYNETAGTTYDNYHRGPDVDNVTLNITYRDLPPISEDAQEAIDDIDEDIYDIIEDIPEDFFEEEFTFEDEFIMIDVLPEIIEEDMYFEDFESFEEFEEMFVVSTEDMEIIEEADMEVIEEEEIEIAELEAEMEMEMAEMEEVESQPEPEAEPEMEIEEEATIEETEEPTKEVQNEETMEDTGESMEEEPENEESVSEANEDENETTEEAEPDSEESEDTEVQTAEAGDEEKISTESEKQIEISTDVGGTTVELKKVEKQLSKIDRMLIQPELDSYEEVEFYESKDIYQDANLELFENQVDLGSYNVTIYAGVTLSAYSVNDPMQIFEERMDFLARQKVSIMLELKKLKGEKND
jgi:hypothetical protein